MFALIAAVIFLLAALHVALGTVDMLFLGLAFLSLQFAWPVGLPVATVWRREPGA